MVFMLRRRVERLIHCPRPHTATRSLPCLFIGRPIRVYNGRVARICDIERLYTVGETGLGGFALWLHRDFSFSSSEHLTLCFPPVYFLCVWGCGCVYVSPLSLCLISWRSVFLSVRKQSKPFLPLPFFFDSVTLYPSPLIPLVPFSVLCALISLSVLSLSEPPHLPNPKIQPKPCPISTSPPPPPFLPFYR